MLEIIKEAQEIWIILSTIALTIGGWYLNHRQRRKKSLQMLFDEYEAMKQKLILGIKTEIEYAAKIQQLKQLNIEEEEALRKKIADLNRLLEEIKVNCPECYTKAVSKINTHGN